MGRLFHPVANIFPLMQGDEFEALKQDIKSNGLREPVWLHPDGSIVDGRNRYRACADIGFEPQYRTWSGQGSLVSFVVSLNLHRRHLTKSQAAAVAIDVLPMLEEEAKGRKLATLKQNQPLVKFLTNGDEPFPKKLGNGNHSGEATQQAAELFSTNRQYVSDAKKIKTEAPDLFEQVKNGTVSISQAKQTLSKGQQMEVILSSESNEWYTPAPYIELTRQVMGHIDLDPASHHIPQKWIRASTYYTLDDDGLCKPWGGNVWLNPPYGKTNNQSTQEIWLNKLRAEYESGRVAQAIALTRVSVGYNWFDNILNDTPVCFLRGLISFMASDGTQAGKAKVGSAFFYFGPDVSLFNRIFCEVGKVVL